jgi:myo-inositol-1(or 4)-monophosphatase
MKEISHKEDLLIRETIKRVGDTIKLTKRDTLEINYKSDGSRVTSSDMFVHREIAQFLYTNYRDDGLVSEEDEIIKSKSGAFWVLDPIDGTSFYIEGKPHYRILLSRVVHGEPVLGAMYLPELNEFLYARKGIGTYRNNRLIRVSENKSAERIFSNVNGAKNWSGGDYPTEGGIAVMALCSGDLEGIIFKVENGKIWDYVSYLPLIEGAGGRVTNGDGNRFFFKEETELTGTLVASNSKCHEEILSSIS